MTPLWGLLLVVFSVSDYCSSSDVQLANSTIKYAEPLDEGRSLQELCKQEVPAYWEFLPTITISYGRALVHLAHHIASALCEGRLVGQVTKSVVGEDGQFRPVLGYPQANPVTQDSILDQLAYPSLSIHATVSKVTVCDVLQDPDRLPVFLWLNWRPWQEQSCRIQRAYQLPTTLANSKLVRFGSTMSFVLTLVRAYLECWGSPRWLRLCKHLEMGALQDIFINARQLLFKAPLKRPSCSSLKAPYSRGGYWKRSSMLLIPGVVDALASSLRQSSSPWSADETWESARASCVVALSLPYAGDFPMELLRADTTASTAFGSFLQNANQSGLFPVGLDLLFCDDWRLSYLPSTIILKLLCGRGRYDERAPLIISPSRLMTLHTFQTDMIHFFPPEVKSSATKNVVLIPMTSSSMDALIPQYEAVFTLLIPRNAKVESQLPLDALLDRRNYFERHLPTALAYTFKRSPECSFDFWNVQNAAAFRDDPTGWLMLQMPASDEWAQLVVSTLCEVLSIDSLAAPGRLLAELMPFVQDAGLEVFQIVPVSLVG